MNKTFGQVLKEARRNQDISQRELADTIGVDFSYISKLENDRLPPPAADTIIKICEALKIPSEILLVQSGKLSSDITDTISASPEAIRFMNVVTTMSLSDDEWKTLGNALKRLR
jgi:transcriptional regulator with XRE-family HTH domain